MKKLLIITFYWKSEKSVAKMRWINLSRELSKLNYKIYILTFGDENKTFNDGDIVIIQRKIKNPFYYLLGSNRKNFDKGVLDSSQNIIFRILSWLRVNFFYPDARILSFNKLIKFLNKLIIENNISTIITSSPPHSIHKIALKLKRTNNIKWISDFRDPYLNWDIFLGLNPTFVSKWIHSKIQSSFLKSSDKIVVTNSNLKKEFSQLGYANKIELVHNGSEIKSIPFKSKKFIISYFGLINKFRDPKVFIDVLDELLSQNDSLKEKFEFHVYGNIQLSTINYLRENKNLNDHLVLKPFISYEKLEEPINSSSILLLLLNNKESQNTTPYKIFDYLVSERPILTLSDFENRDVDSLLRRYQRSKSIKYSDKKGIKDFINKSFIRFNEGQLKNIKCDYSNLRYNRIASKYKEIIES